MLEKFPIAALAPCLALLACAEPPAPVASMRVAPAQVGLPFPHYSTVEIEVEMFDSAEVMVEPLVMVHLLDLAGSVVRTFDHPLPGGWVAGQTRTYSLDLYQSALAPPLDPGVYQLTAGLYDPTEGRWPLQVEGEEVHRMEYAVGSVEVGPSDDAPDFHFSPEWMPTEAGTDIQILGRRWLRGEGTIRLDDLSVAGTVRLDLRIVPPDPQLEDLVLDEGFDTVQVDVATSCGEETWTLRDVGTHVLEIPVSLVVAEGTPVDGDADAGAGSGETASCEILLAPHYRVVMRRNLNSKALALDLLAWRPDSG